MLKPDLDVSDRNVLRYFIRKVVHDAERSLHAPRVLARPQPDLEVELQFVLLQSLDHATPNPRRD